MPKFETEVVSYEDGKIAALSGASPGASTSVSIMPDLPGHCFKDEINSEAWINKLKQMTPSYGHALADDARLCADTRAMTSSALGLSGLKAAG